MSKNDDYYRAILREMLIIKRKYCRNCYYFVNYSCTKKKIYKDCLIDGGKLKRSEINGKS